MMAVAVLTMAVLVVLSRRRRQAIGAQPRANPKEEQCGRDYYDR